MSYDVKSSKAEEFISQEEILATLDYANQNRHNAELISKIIDKASLLKGLTHREASLLLACDLPEQNKKIFDLFSFFMYNRYVDLSVEAKGC